MNVLLLDPEATYVGARQALEKSPAVVVEASDIAGGLAALQNQSFDVAVVAHPVALDFVRALRGGGSTLPVVVLASTSEQPVVLDCLQAGADDQASVQTLDDRAREAARLASLDPHARGLHRSLCLKTLELDVFKHMAVNAQRTGNVVGLVRGVCHELNNPLTGILGYAQLLQEVWEGEGLDDLKEIESCAQRCRDIIGKLARFCRVEKAVLAAVQVNEILEETLQFVEYFANRHRAKVRAELQADLPETMAYASELRHALVAVLVNGIQAMQGKRGGVLSVKTRVSDGSIAIDVTDSGEGIAAEHLQRIFEPFFTTRDPSEASGMGLAVALETMRAHQGTVLVDSTPGVGTTISLVMPVRPVSAVPPLAATASTTA